MNTSLDMDMQKTGLTRILVKKLHCVNAGRGLNVVLLLLLPLFVCVPMSSL